MPPVEFEVEGRAVSWNVAHSGVHWAVRKKISDEWKWRVKAALMDNRINKMPFKGPISIQFEVYVGRPIDCDNVCVKMIIDGLREWGCLVNDDPRYVKGICISVQTKSKREYIKVRIE